MDPDNQYGEQIKERFKQLPKVVQQAIVSADIEKQLRELADKHQLHLDQWGSLEDQVQLTLLGINNSEDLVENIKNEVGVTEETAEALAEDISTIVFEPIRQELERQLEHPEAVAEKTTDMETMRGQMLGSDQKSPLTSTAQAPAAPMIPATPPPPPPQGSAARAPISETYKAGEPSTARKTVHDDPYREPPA